MSNDRFRKGVGYVEDSTLERYHAYEATIPHRRRVKSAWQKAAAVAVCLALLVSTVLFRTPPEPVEEHLHLTMQDLPIRDISGCYPLSAYVNGWSDNIESLQYDYRSPKIIPTEPYLPVYKIYDTRYSKEDGPWKDYSEEEFSAWLDATLPFVKAAYGIDASNYEITQKKNSELQAKLQKKDPSVEALQGQKVSSIYIERTGTELVLNGRPLRLTANRDSYAAVRGALLKIKDEVCRSFGRSFADVEFVIQSYGEIDAYFYNHSDHLYNNKTNRGPATDCIKIIFKAVGEPGATGKTMFTCQQITYHQNRLDYDQMYVEQGLVRRLTLAEASEHLKKGYVKEGHQCYKCAVREADFSTYDYVFLTYIEGDRDGDRIAIPYYVFVKTKINGGTGMGMVSFIRAYVLAIEVEGIEEHFERVAQYHDHWFDD